MRIVVLGNSVAVRIRPPREDSQERTYAEWLRENGHEVSVVAQSGVLLEEAFATLEDAVVTRFPDWVIINHGVVEVCPRQTIRWINNRTIRNYYLNSVLGRPYQYDSPVSRIGHLWWRVLNGGIRRLASLIGLRWRWSSPDRFLRVLEQTIRVILKETGAKVAVLGINPISARVEGQLPGSADAIVAANAAMQGLSGRMGPRVRFLAPDLYLGDPAVMVPDGIHFSAAAHRRIAETLLSLLADPGRTAGSTPAL